MRILVGWELKDYPDAAAFRKLGTCEFKKYDKEFLRKNLKRYDVLVPHLGLYVDDSLLNGASRLRVLATPTTGRDHFDLAACGRRGLQVVSLNDDRPFLETITSTAELAWLLILACARKLPRAQRRVNREKSWRNTDIRGRQLSGLTLGIAGYGRLGRMVERYAHAFGMNVLVFDRESVLPEFGRTVPWAELLRRSDAVSLHAKWLPGEPPLIDARALALIKPGAILVNTSRGGLLDSAAVIKAVRSGRLSAVGLDVAAAEYQEGRLPKDPLVAEAARNPDVLVTPHLGGATTDAHARIFTALARLVKERLARPAEARR